MPESFIAYNFPSQLKYAPIWCMCFFWMLFIGIESVYPQKYSSLSENEKHQLRTTSHILIELEEISLDSLMLPTLSDNVPWAVVPSENREKNSVFLNQYANYRNQLVIIGQEGAFTQVPKNLSLTWLADSDMDTVELDSIGNIDVLKKSSDKELLSIHVDHGNTPTFLKLLEIWKNLGKMPNFIKTEAPFEQLHSLVRQLNTNPKIFGIVQTEKGLLDGVIFKDFGDTQVGGHFSYPVQDTLALPILVPYKPGFHFSPDIIYTSPENLNNQKEFVGFPLDAEYGLSHHFEFKDGVTDLMAKNSKGLISNDVGARKDSLFGRVSYFEDGAYIDVGISSKSALKGNFTISAWVKPTQLGQNNSILGKGDNFVFKIHDGFLTFTMAGVKDYVSTSSPIALNEWSHVALVHSKMGNTLFFYINGERTDSVKLISEYETSDYNILIASNLWEEFFEGYIREIKIWERELNDSEIKTHYNQTKTLNKDTSFLKYVVIFLVLLGGGYGVFKYWRRKSETNEVKATQSIVLPKVPEENDEHSVQILCFGPLQIMDIQGLDIAKKLSPLQKKLFMIIFLHGQGSKKGIDTKCLTELLWPGKSVANAKNTRGTTIQNLRQLLDTCPSLELLFKDKHWVLQMDEKCYSDYTTAMQYLKFLESDNYSDKQLETELRKLIPIVKKGRLFANTSAPWLDPFIEKFSNRIVEQFIQISKNPIIKTHTDIMLDLAEVICLYDDLNEHALQIKLSVLIEQGKLSLAHQACHNFKKQYEKLYGEAYEVSFEEMISSQ
jgi:two-component SAPR family response regulator